MKIKIVAVGDSLTAGYGVDTSKNYPTQLESKLLSEGYDIEVLNMGVSGETSTGLLKRIDSVVQTNPQIVLITIGGNDLLRSRPPQETEENINKIIESLKVNILEKNIYLMEIQSHLSEFNKIFTNIKKNYDVNIVPFVVSVVFLNKSLMLPDRIHPNADGYKYLIDNFILKALKSSL